MNDLTNQNPTNTNVNSTGSNETPVGHGFSMAARFIWTVTLVIIALIALRFAFILFGANSTNGFVNFIYTVSYPFVRPFFGIFNYTTQYGIKRFEPASLIAIAIYAILGYLIVRLLTIHRTRTTS